MTAELQESEQLNSPAAVFRACWKRLVLTDLAFKALTFCLLTPLVSVLVKWLFRLSGKAVLSDLDILFFLISPLGWLCAILIGALWIAIGALEQASLLAILVANAAKRDLNSLPAVGFAITNGWTVMQVAIRIVAFSLLTMSPFLALAGLAYGLLLRQYDINYYLQQRPPECLLALALGLALAATMVVLLMRLSTDWFCALPLVLFERVRPREALRESASRIRGKRGHLLGWLVAWGATLSSLSALATGVTGAVGSWIIPDKTNSLELLMVTSGIAVLLWFVVNLAINVLATTTFAVLLMHHYRPLRRGEASLSVPAALAIVGQLPPGKRLQLWQWASVGVCGMLGAALVGATTVQSIQLADAVQIMAHRGSSTGAPENTLAAFKLAIEERADWIELDVQETADGQVVVLHDSDFMKLAGKKLKIWEATAKDLADLDIGSWFSPEFKDERVPTLAEVLASCRGKIGVNIELKYYGHERQLERRVADIVEATGMESRILVMSLKMEGVKKMKSLRPHWKVGLLMSVAAGNLRKVPADFLAVNAKFVTRELIRAAHNSGKAVYVWTVNDVASMSSMISLGVDGLLTDKPGLARAVMSQRAEMSVPERLLLQLGIALGTTPEFSDQ